MFHQWWQLMQVSRDIVNIIEEAEKEVKKRHEEISSTVLYNQAKVLKAFQIEKVSDDCFYSHEGYGYNDYGREKLEAVFSRVFRGDDALVRPHFVSGTHTLITCLRGLLRPGERLVSITGIPYDTLCRAITGKKKDSFSHAQEGILTDWGILFSSLDLVNSDGEEDLEEILLPPTKVVFIQRSRGYNPFRASLTVDEIAFLVAKVRSVNPEVFILVDNCYGEFVERREPLEVGADLVAGSLIKNPGGGLASTGGYVVGKKDLIHKISNALTAAGLGKDVGAYVLNKRVYFQGFFMAPHTTGEALKGAVTIASALQKVGYSVDPGPLDKRGDIVQGIRLQSFEELKAFCRAIQRTSPVNSHLIPEEGYTAGYTVPIVMAAGTFVQGASSELSADAPLRRPFILFLQGGLTYEHVILGLASLLEEILSKRKARIHESN